MLLQQETKRTPHQAQETKHPEPKVQFESNLVLPYPDLMVPCILPILLSVTIAWDIGICITSYHQHIEDSAFHAAFPNDVDIEEEQ